MNKTKVTIEDIEESLCSLDSVYRESLATTLMKLKYLSDSPLSLSLGNEKQQKELEMVYERPLNSKEIKEIISFISKDMRGDFQYGSFSGIAKRYIDLANKMDVKKKEIER